MSRSFSRRNFLKLGGLSVGSLALNRFTPNLFTSDFISFDDADVVRVATKSVSIYSSPSLDLKKSTITGTWYKDDLVHVYERVTAGEPTSNPVWYRVWGGYMWRARLQPVKTLFNLPLTSIADNTRLLTEITVPFTQPWHHTIARGWEQLDFRLYYGSVYWIEAVEDGPDGRPWYRVYDDLLSPDRIYVDATHLRLIPSDTIKLITPDIPWDSKRIDVNLTTQTLVAYEYDTSVFQTSISSGIPSASHTTTPTGEFHIGEKMPSKHMGNGNLFSGAEDYELPGVPWTSFFTDYGHAFHGTYWHDNFGTPMSHGCVNMRTEDARWLFLWANWVRPPAIQDGISVDNRGYGTTVNIHY